MRTMMYASRLVGPALLLAVTSLGCDASTDDLSGFGAWDSGTPDALSLDVTGTDAEPWAPLVVEPEELTFDTPGTATLSLSNRSSGPMDVHHDLPLCDDRESGPCLSSGGPVELAAGASVSIVVILRQAALKRTTSQVDTTVTFIAEPAGRAQLRIVDRVPSLTCSAESAPRACGSPTAIALTCRAAGSYTVRRVEAAAPLQLRSDPGLPVRIEADSDLLLRPSLEGVEPPGRQTVALSIYASGNARPDQEVLASTVALDMPPQTGVLDHVGGSPRESRTAIFTTFSVFVPCRQLLWIDAEVDPTSEIQWLDPVRSDLPYLTGVGRVTEYNLVLYKRRLAPGEYGTTLRIFARSSRDSPENPFVYEIPVRFRLTE